MATSNLQYKSRDEARDDLYRRFSRRSQHTRRARKIALGLALNVAVQSIAALRRTLDLVIAFVLVRVSLPLLALTFIVLRVQGPAMKRTPRVGRYCEVFDELSFAVTDNASGRLLKRLHLHRLPVLLNIVRGEMSFIGPRVVSPGELSPRDRIARRRYDVRPGLLSLWWLRRRTNIDYASEVEIDREYVESQGLLGDVSLGIRALPAVLYGKPACAASETVKILGIDVDNLTMTESIERIMTILDGERAHQVCFVNADCANIAFKNRSYLKTLQQSSITLADGIGMKLAGKLLANEIKQNVNGTDLFPRLCATLETTDKGIYLLGGRPGVAEGVSEWINANYPGVKISGRHHGYLSASDGAEVIEEIRTSGASLLLVAFGAPMQDLWIQKHLESLGVRAAMGVGGLFDFYSGRIDRAPQWLREMGFEWLYRFYQEPGRMWKRYFVGNGLFLIRVIRERMSNKSSN